MFMRNQNQQKEFTVWQGVGIFALLFVVVMILTGISTAFFGVHPTMILGEVVVFVVPLPFLFARKYSIRNFFTHEGRFDVRFWILTALASVFLYVVVLDITGYMEQLIPRSEEHKELLLKFFLARSWPEYFFRILVVSTSAGFCEEFFFRGFLQPIFSERLGITKGLLLTSFLFAFMHFDLSIFIGIFLLGLFFGYLVYLTKNIWVVIFAHFWIDSVAFSLGFFSPPHVASDFEFTLPLYVTLACMILFIISLGFMRKIYAEQQHT